MNLEKISRNLGNFHARPSYASGTLTVKLEGEGDLDANEAIHEILVAAHTEAQELRAHEVVVDLRQLEFLNSSGIKHFVSWLRDVGRLPTDSAYTIRFLSSPRVPWQRRSLNALRCFAPTLLSIDTDAEATS